MKTFYLFIFLCFYLPYNANSAPTIFEQLADVNTYWHLFNPQTIGLQKQINIGTDQQLLQKHLFLVVEYLSANQKNNLSTSQQKNRLHCLSILHQYAITGLFPQNTNHPYQRTPYFIDSKNTPCAVGHLIIETGFASLASQIQKENNNAYIKDLANKYSEIYSWANTYGFDINELAWIQPGYLFGITYSFPFTLSDTDVLINPSCAGKNDGMIKIDSNTFALSPKPLSTKISYNQQPNPNSDTIFSFYARNYMITVTDANNVSTSITKNLVDPPNQIFATIDTTNVGCNYRDSAGKIEIKNISGGLAPYTFLIENTQRLGSYVAPTLDKNITDTNSIYANLRTNNYRIFIKDAKGCAMYKQVMIRDSSAIASSFPTYIVQNNCHNNNATVEMYCYDVITYNLILDTLVLPVGINKVTFTNVFGCKVTLDVDIPETHWYPRVYGYWPMLCNGGDARVLIDVQEKYQSHSGPFIGEGVVIRNAGENIFVVTDKFGCMDSVSLTIKEPIKLSNQTIFPPIEKARGATKITQITSGGIPPYSYNVANESVLNSGNYEIITTDSNGCKSTNSISILEPNISISPNPVISKLKITGIKTSRIGNNLLIYDMLGKLILSKKIIDIEMELDLHHLANGVYILKIDTEIFNVEKL